MALGEVEGVAAALALQGDQMIRAVDYREVQRKMRAQGADPGDVPSANATETDGFAQSA